MAEIYGWPPAQKQNTNNGTPTMIFPSQRVQKQSPKFIASDVCVCAFVCVCVWIKADEAGKQTPCRDAAAHGGMTMVLYALAMVVPPSL